MPEAISKTGWSRHRFDDMAVVVNDRIDDPSEADVEFYVGLEHLDSDSLTIRRWGSPSDVEATKLRFRKGDIIFGRRRVYQRKLAVADFDGICSAHAMVLRAKPKVVLPEFLPFFMQSDLFMERAREISVGSLSPTINWKTLAQEEFALPPLDEQRRIARILDAAMSFGDAYKATLGTLDQLIRTTAITEFKRAQRTASSVRLANMADLKMGRQKAPKYAKGVNLRPFIRVVNVGELELLLDDIETMDFTDIELERFRLLPGDIVLTEGDLISKFNVGRPAMFNGEIEDCCFQNTLIRLRPRTGLDPYWCLMILEGARLSGIFARAAKTTTVTHLGLGRLSEVEMPIASQFEQQVAARQFIQLLEARANVRQRIKYAVNIMAFVSESVFV